MIQGLIILTGAVPGSRDLMWVEGEDPAAIGYFVFRAENRYGPWTRLTEAAIPGNRYRDETSLVDVDYTLQAADWVSLGQAGHYMFRLPETPLYGEVVAGRATIASQPTHVHVTVDGQLMPVARVDGIDSTVWLASAFGLKSDADRKEYRWPVPTKDSVVQIRYKRLANFVAPTPETRCYYTVIPVLDNGTLAHEPGAAGSEVINTLEVEKMDYIQAEMVRRNAYLLEREGEPTHLLIRRTKGTKCGCVSETGARTGCPSCYETGIIGGYYGPYDFLFLDPDTAATIEVEEQGKKTTRQSTSWCGPTPVLQAGDIIVRKNGERLAMSAPIYKSPKGVLLQQSYTANLIPYGDTRYRIPIRPPLQPIPYNPAFEAKPGEAGEPVVSPLTDPTKQWENTTVPQGRTVVFGNIQT